jgi:molybdopterin/thiamine biosynthesis adenylyltransferase
VYPEKVLILGAGGIGSWVTLSLALAGVNQLYLIDYDTIEEHNLNRTLFRDTDINMLKTEAIEELILERRDKTDVMCFNKRLEELTESELNQLKNVLIIDCRDNIIPLPESLQQNPLIKCGYDGLSITIILNPKYDSLWDLEPNEEGYTVTPSFLVPCSFLATVITSILTDPDFDLSKYKNKVITFDVRNKIKEIYDLEV